MGNLTQEKETIHYLVEKDDFDHPFSIKVVPLVSSHFWQLQFYLLSLVDFLLSWEDPTDVV